MQVRSVSLRSAKQTENRQAYTNLAYTDPESFQRLYSLASENAVVGQSAVRCEVKGFVFTVGPSQTQEPGELGVNIAQRTCARIGLNDALSVQPWQYRRPLENVTAATVHVSLQPVMRDGPPLNLSEAQVEQWCRARWQDQVLTMNQMIIVEATDTKTGNSCNLYATISRLEGLDFGQNSDAASLLTALITPETEFVMESSAASLQIEHNPKSKQRNLFKTDFNFEQLGIGGLDKEFADIFRRAFASRIYPPHVVQQLGITHVRGMLLFGPPGTGKTLIARQIGKALRAKEPKIVNGPEVLNKYVGQSEENVRKLFAEAEADQKKLGDNSPLHIIIFDELDAICKQRGSNPSSAGVSDSIVNQLLSKIDGVDALNNILLIGMTNRMDMLDEALLRPGRLEVHIEIGLPDEAGRLQILRIHSKNMQESNRMAADVSLEELARRTRNFSGAELAGLIRSAVSYAFARNVDPANIAKPSDDEVVVSMADFDHALEEVQPAFGVSEESLSKYILNDIVSFSHHVEKLQTDLSILTEQVRRSPKSPLVSLLLYGASGSGKTAMACRIAQLSEFPFVKIISPNDFIGFTELAKCDRIKKVFDDAYKSELSIIILDDIERILDYAAIGPRFSNLLLQTLMVLVKRLPPKDNRRILIIGTTSEPSFMENSGLVSAFQLAFRTPLIRTGEALMIVLKARIMERKDLTEEEAAKLVRSIFSSEMGDGSGKRIAVKPLFMALEMASEIAKPNSMTASDILSCLKDYGMPTV